MESKNIDKIIEKYLQGESSLKEEGLLKEYFSVNRNLPEEHKDLAIVFNFYLKSGNEKSTLKLDDIVTEKKRHPKTRNLTFLAIAASIALFVSVFIIQNQPTEKKVYAYVNGVPVENKEVAIAEAQKALLLISKNLNQGTQNLNHLKEFNKAEEILRTN